MTNGPDPDDPATRQTRIAVIVCSVGRPDCLSGLLAPLAAQSRPADRVLFVVTRPEDIGVDPRGAFGPRTDVEVIVAPKGLPRQRNAGLDRVMGDADLIVFFDDDYVPSRHALAGIEAGFAAWPEVGGMTGALIADGINSPGLSTREAERLVAEWDAVTPPPGGRPLRIVDRDLAGLYGCNMAYRASHVGDVRFDERLPLYAWQEDIDFAARIAGRRIRTDAFAGVHRGARSGREIAGHRLGYSQIANPWYLWRKGTMTASFALRLAVRNLAANHLRAARPEPWIDRAARARGNRIALLDVIRGRADPERILSL
ncbi:glycosyltransferase family 2 protein [Wenxinia marina]|uniref:Putative glycosyltransferase n=1 Tax=Wenxinia marina DSM 24838 TaxID=1123501 RepID=A0A0D0Q5J5_9RHOB|nr:glycosyltransferase [Wenxinia marina]KIQ67762.1 putative glycosyltransferase [Wenxinia marina DSM 24838]GGL77446.1 glycosyl transferase [Wenxinia marina]